MKRTNKKLAIGRETLKNLEAGQIERAPGAGSWNSDCALTCGDHSCGGVCTLNCSWIRCV